MSETLKDLMSKMGTGVKSSEDMNKKEARKAIKEILYKNPDPTVLGGFLVANRWKKNTPEELSSYLDVLRNTQEIFESSVDIVDCGANYDGKKETPILGFPAGIVSASNNSSIVVHSGDRIPTKKGDTYKHVLEKLDIITDIEPGESAKMVDKTGFGFYYQSRFNPLLDNLYKYRDKIGVRTFFNTIETLSNPGNSDIHIGSFYHIEFAKKIIETLKKSNIELDRILMFQGLEGYDDIRPGYTKVVEWDGSLNDYTIESSDYGMDFDRKDLKVENVAKDTAKITKEVFNGERKDQFFDAICLNAAFRLYADRTVNEIKEGIEMSKNAIGDGLAKKTLKTLIEF